MALIQVVPSKLFIRLSEKSDARRETDKGGGREGGVGLNSYKVSDLGCYNFPSFFWPPPQVHVQP